MKAPHLKGQLFGYRELPEASGLWGLLLPRPGDKAAAHEPAAQDVVEQLDSERLVFANPERVGDRGFGLSFGGSFVLLMSVTLLPLFTVGMAGARTKLVLWEWVIFMALLAALIGVPAAWAVVSARAPLPAPVIISRRLRRIFAWPENGMGWISLDYDEVVPATFVRRVVTPSGSGTLYILTLCQLKQGTREIEYSVVPAPARGHPEFCGAMWEFVRRYMDGEAHALPPVRLVPRVTHAKAWMARTDRTVFADHIDDCHRVKRDGFSMAVVWFWGSVGYWWERAAGWIERTAPRRALPPELLAGERQPSASEYRIIPHSPVEQQAQAGTLPHMRRRWFICGVLSTAIWGAMFGRLAAAVWMNM